VASDRKVWVLLADGLKVFSKMVIQSTFGLSDAKWTTLGTANAIDQVEGGPCEALI